MIPLRDNIRSRRRPIVNYLLIAACGIGFLLQLRQTSVIRDPLVERYGMIPARVLDPDRKIEIRVPVTDPAGHLLHVDGQLLVRHQEVASPPFSPWLTLLTCIFLHGGWMHFLGNMWFLYIFGDNVEDRMGRIGYLAFYLLAGITAGLVHVASGPDSVVPTIGASGAIAAVMGAYLLLYPRAKVLTLLPLFFYFQILVVPAPLFLGIWFAIQFFQGTFAVSSMDSGGIAWWAHIGGFACGVGVVLIARQLGKLQHRKIEILPDTHRLSRYASRGRYRRRR